LSTIRPMIQAESDVVMAISAIMAKAKA